MQKIENQIKVDHTQAEILIDKLKKNLYNQNLKELILESYLRQINDEINLLDSNREVLLNEGEIVTCNFGFSIPVENYGLTEVMVLCKTEKNKYLVVPFCLSNSDENMGRFCMKLVNGIDVIFYDDKYMPKYTILYLNKIQEVSSVRLEKVKKTGELRKTVVRHVFQEYSIRMTQSKAETLDEVLQEKIDFAIWKSADGENEKQKMETFFKIMQISEEFVFLRSSFFIALSVKGAVLKEIVYLMSKQYSEYSEAYIKRELNIQFKEWLEILGVDALMQHEKVSLSRVLKIFINNI